MACLEIKSPNGELQVIQENTPYPAGWAFTGGISWNCGEAPLPVGPTVEEELTRRGVQWGDAIAWVTKKAGIKQCGPCKARQEILNNVANQGWTETIKQIRGTL